MSDAAAAPSTHDGEETSPGNGTGQVGLIVWSTEGGPARGFTDTVAAYRYSKTVRGLVGRIPVVADHRRGGAA